ncbi:ubiquitin-activating enzyme E1, putative [Theileria equi strain WA]|uniref:Ubiquitin-activating enzyme E1, putative n=1 Tax=Theileria equi strain WA TaxID=1537102 RepID=L0AVC3_THEEQ|nr:ubiquitin-activating enzyme E1, putative [Theileria equi strain WA]AFZ79198.1 ubiquitin-activating enzyme E1, putative [Theileria equi strain WA]|eukprot:XP_004828864.1 ubiquitin-activating enzyme E1, putative [Theileria equi strain WA]
MLALFIINVVIAVLLEIATCRSVNFKQDHVLTHGSDLRNPNPFLGNIKTNNISKLPGRQDSVHHGRNSKGKATSVVHSGICRNLFSRVELVLGSNALDSISSANVLIVGANELSNKVIAHFIRSGIGSICIWDDDTQKSNRLVERISLLHPDANINILKSEPNFEKEASTYRAIVFLNQPLQSAIEANDRIHNKCKFVFASTIGAYGLVFSDFGTNHLVTTRSDDKYPEHSCKFTSAGNKTWLETTSKVQKSFYSENDTVNLTYAHYLLNENKGETDIQVLKCKVSRVVEENNNVKLLIDLDTRGWPQMTVSISKVDEPFFLDFAPLSHFIKSIFSKQSYFTLFLDKIFLSNPAGRLLITPKSGNIFNNDHLSVISSFLAFDQMAFNFTGTMDFDWNYHRYFIDLCRKIYPQCDDVIASNFNKLRHFHIPPIDFMVGAFVAQETIKGITNIFTPSELVLIDRSDLFLNKSGNVDFDIVKKVMSIVSNYSYLVVGAGALGCDYLRMLAEMSVSRVNVFDDDTVEISNLSRQCLFTPDDVGKGKAESAIKNLNRLHDNTLKDYKYHKLLFTDSFETRAIVNSIWSDKTIALSAVDNMQGRITLDNFCIENNIPLVEAGIHGMKCSTSIFIPHITESYSSTMQDKMLVNDKSSCTVKGIPKTIEDTVHYSMELFSWLFDSQHVFINKFMMDPVKTLRQTMDHGHDYFLNAIQVIKDNCDILSSESESEIDKKILKWANKNYLKYIGYDSPLGDIWISSLIRLKTGCLTPKKCKKLTINESFIDEIKSQVIRFLTAFKRKGNNSELSKGSYEKCFRAISELFEDKNVRKALESANFSYSSIFFEENREDCLDFIYATSNMRAFKYNIHQKDKLSILGIAKAIVPAISTCVSIAASTSLLEVYRIAILSQYNIFGHDSDLKSTNFKNSKGIIGDIYLSLYNDDISIWFSLSDKGLRCFNKNKLIATLKPFNYLKSRNHCNYFNHHFFNLSIMKHFSNHPNPPYIFQVTNPNASLYGLSLSFWDYILVDEQSAHFYNFKTHKNVFKKNGILVGELVKSIENMFDVIVEGFASPSGYILINDLNNRSSLSDLFFSPTGQVVISILAYDRHSNKRIELPDINYRM